MKNLEVLMKEEIYDELGNKKIIEAINSIVVPDISGKEDSSNKVITIGEEVNDTDFPTTKAVKDYVDIYGGGPTIEFDGNFKKVGNELFLGSKEINYEFMVGDPYVSITQNGIFKIDGDTQIINGTITSKDGIVRSLDPIGNTITAITLTNIQKGESITYNGIYNKWSTNLVKIALNGLPWVKHAYANVFNLNVGTPYLNYALSNEALIPNIICDDLEVVSADQLLARNTCAGQVPKNGICILSDGRLFIRHPSINLLTEFQTWMTTNLPNLGCRIKTDTLTPIAFNNLLSLKYGGAVVFNNNNTIIPNITCKAKKILLEADIGDGVPSFETIGLNTDAANSLSGYSKVLLAGTSSTTISTNTTTVNEEKNPKTTKGTLYSSVLNGQGAEVILSSIVTPELYGGNGISDYLTETSIVRNYSDNFYLKDTWNWTGGTVVGNRRLFTTELSASEFLIAPYQNLESETPYIITDYSIAQTGTAIKADNDGVGYTKIAFYWDSVKSKYIVIVNVYQSYIYVTASLPTIFDSFKYQIIKRNKTHFRYRVATPITTDLVNKLVTRKNAQFKWITDSDAAKYISYSTVAIQVPTNLYAVTSIESIITNVNALNYAVQNISISAAKLGFPDGVTDNLTILQAAIDSSVANSTSLILPSGTYLITDALIVPANTTIQGSGKTIIKVSNSAKHGLWIKGSNVKISNLTIQMPANNDTSPTPTLYGGIYVDGTLAPQFISLENITIKGAIAENKTNVLAYSYDNIDDKTCGILALRNTNYVNYLSVDKCIATNLYCGLYNQATPTKATLTCDYVIYGMWIESLAGDYYLTGHNRSIPNAKDAVNKTHQIILNKSCVYCNGGSNSFSGFMYDIQRCEHLYEFGTKAANNTYQNPFCFIDISNYVYTNVWFDDYDGSSIDYPHTYHIVKDLGSNNKNINSPQSRKVEPIVGSSVINLPYRDATNTLITPRTIVGMMGQQDNALANVHKYGVITCANTLDNGTINDVFSTISGTNGFQSGVTFTNSPSDVSPIVITGDLSNYPIKSLSKFGIQFNQYIAKRFKLFRWSSEQWVQLVSVSDNTFPNYWWSSTYGEEITKFKIEIYEAFTQTDYNPNSKVGISLIWGFDGFAGGRAYEPAITNITPLSTNYLNGSKGWSDFATSVRNSLLTGISFLVGEDLAETDTVVQALGKVWNKITGIINSYGQPNGLATLNASGEVEQKVTEYIYTETIETSPWINQPAIDGELDVDFALYTTKPYFVTLKEIDKSIVQNSASFTSGTLIITETAPTLIIGEVITIRGSSITNNNKSATINSVYNPSGIQTTYTFAASTFTAGTSTTPIWVTTPKALPIDQFKLMDSKDDYMTAYDQVFTLTGLNTGTLVLTENFLVDFNEIGLTWKLRNGSVAGWVKDIDGVKEIDLFISGMIYGGIASSSYFNVVIGKYGDFNGKYDGEFYESLNGSNTANVIYFRSIASPTPNVFYIGGFDIKYVYNTVDNSIRTTSIFNGVMGAGSSVPIVPIYSGSILKSTVRCSSIDNTKDIPFQKRVGIYQQSNCVLLNGCKITIIGRY